MANTRHSILQANFDRLVNAAKSAVPDIARKAFAKNLITSQNLKDALNLTQPEDLRATTTLLQIMDKIKENPTHFDTFVSILKEVSTLTDLGHELSVSVSESHTGKEGMGSQYDGVEFTSSNGSQTPRSVSAHKELPGQSNTELSQVTLSLAPKPLTLTYNQVDLHSLQSQGQPTHPLQPLESQPHQLQPLSTQDQSHPLQPQSQASPQPLGTQDQPHPSQPLKPQDYPLQPPNQPHPSQSLCQQGKPHPIQPLSTQGLSLRLSMRPQDQPLQPQNQACPPQPRNQPHSLQPLSMQGHPQSLGPKLEDIRYGIRLTEQSETVPNLNELPERNSVVERTTALQLSENVPLDNAVISPNESTSSFSTNEKQSTGSELSDTVSSDRRSESDSKQTRSPFSCPCCGCTLSAHLDGSCPGATSDPIQFPYLHKKGLDTESQVDLEAKLQKDTQDMIRKFNNLLFSTEKSLEDNKVTPDKVASRVLRVSAMGPGAVCKPLLKEHEGNILCAKSVSRILLILTPYISFFNHEILKQLIGDLGTEEDKQKLHQYMLDFDHFCKRSVFEVPPAVYAQVSDNPEKRKMFAVKLSTEGQMESHGESTKDVSVAHVRKTQQRISDIVGLNPGALFLCHIDEGCVKLTFLIPTFAADMVFPLNETKVIALSKIGVTLVAEPLTGRFLPVSTHPSPQNQPCPSQPLSQSQSTSLQGLPRPSQSTSLQGLPHPSQSTSLQGLPGIVAEPLSGRFLPVKTQPLSIESPSQSLLSQPLSQSGPSHATSLQDQPHSSSTLSSHVEPYVSVRTGKEKDTFIPLRPVSTHPLSAELPSSIKQPNVSCLQEQPNISKLLNQPHTSGPLQLVRTQDQPQPLLPPKTKLEEPLQGELPLSTQGELYSIGVRIWHHQRMFSSETLQVVVRSSDTIGNLKMKIVKRKNYQCELLFGQTRLEDGRTLRDYNIEKDSMLDLVEIMTFTQVYVRIPDIDAVSKIHQKILCDVPRLQNESVQFETMRICVMMGTEKSILLEILASDKIKVAKRKIQDKEGIPTYQQKLTFDDNQLKSFHTLSDYNIQNGSTLYLERMSPCGFAITVQTLTPGKKILLEVEANDTIADVKSKIQDIDGIPPDNQQLIYGGRVLSSQLTIRECNIHERVILTLMWLPFNLVEVFVKMYTGKTVTMEVRGDDTVESVKEHLYCKEGIPPQYQLLMFDGKVLQDEQLLVQYNIKESSVLHLEHSLGDGAIIGKTIAIEVKESDTVKDLKMKIEDKEGIAHDWQRLRKGGNELKDGQTLSSYNVKKESILHLELKQHGSFPILVMTETGKTVILDVKGSDTVEEVKTRIKIGNPQNLYFRYWHLKENIKLGAYDIGKLSTLAIRKPPTPRESSKTSLHILTSCGKTIELNETAEISIKRKLHVIENIPPDQQQLIFDGQRVEDNHRLSYCDEHSLLHLFDARSSMQIAVKTADGKTASIGANPDDTVLSLKVRMQTEMPQMVIPSLQQLSFNGEELKDGQSLQHYSICNGSVVDISVPEYINLLIMEPGGAPLVVVRVHPYQTVSSLKSQLKHISRIDPKYQQLVCTNGEILEDRHTLDKYNLNSQSVVHLKLCEAEHSGELVQQRLDSQGKTISWSEEGVSVRIPEGAVPKGQEVTLTIRKYDAKHPQFAFPDDLEPTSPVYEVLCSQDTLLKNALVSTKHSSRVARHKSILKASRAPILESSQRFAPKIQFSSFLRNELDTGGDICTEQLNFYFTSVACSDIRRTAPRMAMASAAALEPSELRVPSLSDRPTMEQLRLLRYHGGEVRVIDEMSCAPRLQVHPWRLHRCAHFLGIKEPAAYYHIRLDDPKPIIEEMLEEWLDGNGRDPVTWETLIHALECSDFDELADELRTALNWQW